MDTGIQIAGNGDYWPVVDEVVALVADLGADAVIVANRFVRPTFQSGRTVLVVTALDDHRFRPYEIEHQHQCCGGH